MKKYKYFMCLTVLLCSINYAKSKNTDLININTGKPQANCHEVCKNKKDEMLYPQGLYSTDQSWHEHEDDKRDKGNVICQCSIKEHKASK